MRRGRPTGKIIASLLLGLLIVLAGSRGMLSPVQDLVAAIFRPVGQLLTKAGAGTGDFGGMLGSVSRLNQENNQLRRRVNELESETTNLKEVRHQNEVLRRQLGFNDAAEQELLAAEVVAYQPDNFRQFFTINRGSADGVKTGQAVVSEGLLVGKIDQVGAHTAKVFLAVDPEFRVNGIGQEGRASGTVSGQLGAGLIMDKIPQNEGVKVGETIITSGLGGEMPRGLVIGRVEAVEQSDNAIFQAARIATSLKFNKLEVVFVVQSK